MTHRWGPHFPDAARNTYTMAAVAAKLSLAPTVTNSGAFDLATLKALVGGAAGNLITVQFKVGALTDVGEIHETGNACLILFNDGATTLANFATLFASSGLVQMTGTWDPLATAAAGDDEFGPTHLAGGADARSTYSTHFGPHFPDSPPPATIPGIGPAGAATLALALEAGFTVTYSWGADIFKSYSGLEERAATLDDPKQSYHGPALLLGADTATLRMRLQQFAALGQAFLLALPYEALTLSAASTGTTLHVPSTAMCDWALPGQRVAVVQIDDDLVEWSPGVVQAVTATTIVLDVAPGSIGAAGSLVMPAVAVYLEPQQAFDRYRPADVLVERWTVAARAAFFGFFAAPTSAYLSLAPTVTNSGAATGVTLVAIASGAAGNAVTVQLVHGALTGAGEIDETGTACVIKFDAGTTTMTQFAALVAASSLITMTGAYVGGATLQLGDDEFGPTALAHGADQAPGTMGLGATVKTYFGRPLWDRGVDSDGTIPDSMQSMVEIVDLGGLPFSVGMATKPDYGRDLALAKSLGPEWQWLKAFLFAIRGAQVAFWLPTFREDLLAIGNGPGGGTTGTIHVSSAIGDFFTWWPEPRTHVRMDQGALSFYAEVTAAVDNHDGTLTLTLATDPADLTAVLPAAAPIDNITWLELVRMDTDDVPVTFKDSMFAVATTARVVQQ